MLAGCCPQGCFFLLTCLGRQGCHAACFTAHREAEKTTKSSTAVSCPKRSLFHCSSLWLTQEGNAQAAERRWLNIIASSLLGDSGWSHRRGLNSQVFSAGVDVAKGYSKVLSHSSAPHSDPSLAFQGTECQSLINTFQCWVRFASLYTSNTKKKHAQESCLYFVWSNTANPKVGLRRTADRCNTCTDSLESFAIPLEPVWPVNIMCCSLSIAHLLQ